MTDQFLSNYKHCTKWVRERQSQNTSAFFTCLCDYIYTFRWSENWFVNVISFQIKTGEINENYYPKRKRKLTVGANPLKSHSSRIVIVCPNRTAGIRSRSPPSWVIIFKKTSRWLRSLRRAMHSTLKESSGLLMRHKSAIIDTTTFKPRTDSCSLTLKTSSIAA